MKSFEALIEGTEEIRTLLFRSMYRIGSIRNRSDMRFEMRAEGLSPDNWHVLRIMEREDEGNSSLLGFTVKGIPEGSGKK